MDQFLDGGVLVSIWPELYLPRGVRRAWEDHHPSLRAASDHGHIGPVLDLDDVVGGSQSRLRAGLLVREQPARIDGQ